jgi:DNA-binding response OmpR family regulator
MKILVIEDEKDLRETIVTYLKHEGYVCESAADYKEAQEKILIYKYDCIIVDIMLPGGSGLQLIQELKKAGMQGGVIIISANDSVDDRIKGLEIGSDDYLTKPFHLSELNARIKSIIRRWNFKGNTEIKFNEIKILPDSHEVFVNESLVPLTIKEYDLLLFFISNKSKVIPKDSIAEHLWGDNMDQTDSFEFIYTHIKNLRKKLVQAGSNDYINTVYGIGYKFQAE